MLFRWCGRISRWRDNLILCRWTAHACNGVPAARGLFRLMRYERYILLGLFAVLMLGWLDTCSATNFVWNRWCQPRDLSRPFCAVLNSAEGESPCRWKDDYF
ncbi:MAG: hypothetical protein ACLR7U_09640 [Ruthenibacterium lactatiformans]